jgi:hypothetical protein
MEKQRREGYACVGHMRKRFFSLERKKERTKKEDNETKVYLTELTSNLPLLGNFVLCLIFFIFYFFLISYDFDFFLFYFLFLSIEIDFISLK